MNTGTTLILPARVWTSGFDAPREGLAVLVRGNRIATAASVPA